MTSECFNYENVLVFNISGAERPANHLNLGQSQPGHFRDRQRRTAHVPGSYPKFGASQRSASASENPLRRA